MLDNFLCFYNDSRLLLWKLIKILSYFAQFFAIFWVGFSFLLLLLLIYLSYLWFCVALLCKNLLCSLVQIKLSFSWVRLFTPFFFVIINNDILHWSVGGSKWLQKRGETSHIVRKKWKTHKTTCRIFLSSVQDKEKLHATHHKTKTRQKT